MSNIKSRLLNCASNSAQTCLGSPIFNDAYNEIASLEQQLAASEKKCGELVESLEKAFTDGYEMSHDHTVEGCYTDSSECFKDWLKDKALSAEVVK